METRIPSASAAIRQRQDFFELSRTARSSAPHPSATTVRHSRKHYPGEISRQSANTSTTPVEKQQTPTWASARIISQIVFNRQKLTVFSRVGARAVRMVLQQVRVTSSQLPSKIVLPRLQLQFPAFLWRVFAKFISAAPHSCLHLALSTRTTFPSQVAV